MRPGTNNQIDLLLRRMARGESAARDGGVQRDDRHLDADELSSYAQNALPPTARTRYTEHLAECASCRKIVAELSLSPGSSVIAAPLETSPEPSAWKKFFASLFAPIVLRYAVPALGVIVVMVVGFVVLRRQGQHAFIAKLEQPEASTPATPAATQTPSTAVFGVQKDRVETQDAKADNRSNTQSGPVDNRTAGVGDVAAAPPARNEKSAAESQPTVTPESSPSAAAKAAAPQPTAAQATASVTPQADAPKEEAKPEVARQNSNEAPRDQVSQRGTQPGNAEQDKTKPESKPQSSADSLFAVQSGALAGRRVQGLKKTQEARRREDSKDAETSTANEETRTIAGRHFRKQGNIWIDTAYESSTATVNMARNSDQFRALVADEPAIATIVKQLDGEVIVVWKGRAYRIR